MRSLALFFFTLALAVIACGPATITLTPTQAINSPTPHASASPEFDTSSLWFLTRGDVKSDQAWGADTDSQGNLYVAAYKQKPASRLFFDIVVYKFSSDGKELWQTQWMSWLLI